MKEKLTPSAAFAYSCAPNVIRYFSAVRHSIDRDEYLYTDVPMSLGRLPQEVDESAPLISSEMRIDVVEDVLGNQEIIDAYRQQQHLTILQYAGQGIYRYMIGVTPIVYTATQLQLLNIIPNIPMIAEYPIAIFLVNAHIAISDFMHTFVTREHPLEYWRRVGGGDLKLGFMREAAKFILSVGVPMTASIGCAYRVHILQQESITNGDQEELNILDKIALPVLHYNLLGISSRILYGMTRRLIETRYAAPDYKYNEVEHLNLAQKISQYLLRGLDDIMTAEMIKFALNIIFGDHRMYKNYFTLMPVLVDVMLLQPLRYLAFTPHPWEKVQAPWKKDAVVEIFNGAHFEAVAAQVTHADRIKTVVIDSVCIVTIAAAASFLANAIMPADMEQNNFPAEMQRVGVEAGVLGLTICIYEAAKKVTHSLIRNVSQMRAGLFFQRNWGASVSINADEESPQLKY